MFGDEELDSFTVNLPFLTSVFILLCERIGGDVGGCPLFNERCLANSPSPSSLTNLDGFSMIVSAIESSLTNREIFSGGTSNDSSTVNLEVLSNGSETDSSFLG